MADPDRTEEPTPRKLQRARERGEVAQSRLLSGALVLLAVGAALHFGAAASLARWRGLVEALWAPSSMPPGEALGAAADVAASMLGAPLAIAVGVGALASFLQVGPLFTWKPVTPDFARLDPGRGLGRLFSPGELLPRFGGMALAVAVVVLAGALLVDALPALLAPLGDARAVLQAGNGVVGAFFVRACALLTLAGAVALVYRRAQYRDAQRMSRRELRQEQRELEGEPQAKRRRTELHRERALGRTPEEALVGAALVVVGTDRAIVLGWDPASDAPAEVRLAARGPSAARVRVLATRAGVPSVMDEGLAQALERPREGGVGRPWLVRLARHLARAGPSRSSS
jgi:flagellar biosynthesis protein FlhB